MSLCRKALLIPSGRTLVAERIEQAGGSGKRRWPGGTGRSYAPAFGRGRAQVACRAGRRGGSQRRRLPLGCASLSACHFGRTHRRDRGAAAAAAERSADRGGRGMPRPSLGAALRRVPRIGCRLEPPPEVARCEHAAPGGEGALSAAGCRGAAHRSPHATSAGRIGGIETRRRDRGAAASAAERFADRGGRGMPRPSLRAVARRVAPNRLPAGAAARGRAL